MNPEFPNTRPESNKSLRAYFAAHALSGLAANHTFCLAIREWAKAEREDAHAFLAKYAFRIADLMLLESASPLLYQIAEEEN